MRDVRRQFLASLREPDGVEVGFDKIAISKLDRRQADIASLRSDGRSGRRAQDGIGAETPLKGHLPAVDATSQLHAPALLPDRTVPLASLSLR